MGGIARIPWRDFSRQGVRRGFRTAPGCRPCRAAEGARASRPVWPASWRPPGAIRVRAGSNSVLSTAACPASPAPPFRMAALLPTASTEPSGARPQRGHRVRIGMPADAGRARRRLLPAGAPDPARARHAPAWQHSGGRAIRSGGPGAGPESPPPPRGNGPAYAAGKFTPARSEPGSQASRSGAFSSRRDPGSVRAVAFAVRAGSCWERQCSVPRPHTRSTA